MNLEHHKILAKLLSLDALREEGKKRCEEWATLDMADPESFHAFDIFNIYNSEYLRRKYGFPNKNVLVQYNGTEVVRQG